MRTLFPEGHDVFASGLEYVEDSREWEDRQRILALVGDQYGVVSGLEVTDTSAVTPDITISAGLAIDALGQRVVLDSSTSITGLLPSDIGSYVVIYQNNLDIFPTSHPITGASAYTREIDGATVVVSGAYASGLTGYVLLACISNVVTGGVPSVSVSTTLRSCREELRIDPQRLGTAMDVNEHRLSAHEDGISGGTGSLIPSIIDAATDYIAFTAMAAGTWISINGVLLGVDEINPITNKYVYFSTVTDAAGSWNIYIDNSGNTGKTQAALTADQFLLATVVFDNISGDLSSLVDSRIFYEMTQDLVRVDLTEAQTNDSLTAASTLRNNLNRIRYRLNTLETTAGGAYPVIGNTGGDYNGTTDAIFNTAIADLPAAGGTLVLADGTWIFGGTVIIDRPVHLIAEGHSHIVLNGAVPGTLFSVQSSGVIFEGIVFDFAASGGAYHLIDVVDEDSMSVRECRLNADGGGLTDDFVRIAGGRMFEIENNTYITDNGRMPFLRVVQSAGNVTSGLMMTENITMGEGSPSLFSMNSGTLNGAVISNNITIEGNSFGDTWIYFNAGCAVDNVSIDGNAFQSTGGTGVYGISSFAAGNLTISNNTLKLTGAGGTTYGIFASTRGTIIGNTIVDADNGIVIGGTRSLIGDNSIQGATVNGIYLTSAADNSVVKGNMVYGTAGTNGIYLLSDDCIVDSNYTEGFTTGLNDGGANNWAGTTDNTSNKDV